MKIYKAYITWHGDSPEGSLGYFLKKEDAERVVREYKSPGPEYMNSLGSGVRGITILKLFAVENDSLIEINTVSNI